VIDQSLHRYSRSFEAGFSADPVRIDPHNFVQNLLLLRGHIFNLDHWWGLGNLGRGHRRQLLVPEARPASYLNGASAPGLTSRLAEVL